MSADLPNISAIVPTRNRAPTLRRTLESLVSQSMQPAEIIIVDASENLDTQAVCKKGIASLRSQLRWAKAKERGGASQRNEGVALATQATIWFFDDDILFEEDCLANLWRALQAEPQLGGVNAMIVNQRYQSPGTVSRLVFTLLNGRGEKTFAGKVIGPAINLLPEDRDGLPEVVPVEWLNTTCTMYRREALPSPPFDSFFTGYSLMEDLTLSLRVAQRGWKLANARTARVFHDSQKGEHKEDAAALAEMELLNRHYVMAEILHRRSMGDYLKLAFFETFSLLSLLLSRGSLASFRAALAGKGRAAARLRAANKAARVKT